MPSPDLSPIKDGATIRKKSAEPGKADTTKNQMTSEQNRKDNEWRKYIETIKWDKGNIKGAAFEAFTKARESKFRPETAFVEVCELLKRKKHQIDVYAMVRQLCLGYKVWDQINCASEQTLPRANASAEADDSGPKHYYCPAIASSLNMKQPDITAAAVMYNLSLWQGNRYKQTLIDERRFAFRSLSELKSDLPYLTESAIHQAIQRLEKHFKEGFEVRRDKNKLWFSVGDKQLKMMKGRLLGYYVADAMEGSIREAVLLANCKYALSAYTNPVTDDLGNRYAELNPEKLKSILGCSADTICRLLKKLIERKTIIEHPSRRRFFTLGKDYRVPHEPVKPTESQSAEVNADPAEVDASAAELDMSTADVNTTEGTDSNIVSNECGNESCKGNTKILLPSNVLIKSESLLLLVKLATEHADKRSLIIPSKTFVSPDDLPYDIIVGEWDLPYNVYDPNQLTIHGWAKEQAKEVENMWRRGKIKVSKHVKDLLEKMFECNPHIDAETIIEIYHFAHHQELFGTKVKVNKRKFDENFFLKKARSPEAFLRYLPQIITQYEGEMNSGYGVIQYQESSFFDNIGPSMDYSWMPSRGGSRIAPEPVAISPVILDANRNQIAGHGFTTEEYYDFKYRFDVI